MTCRKRHLTILCCCVLAVQSNLLIAFVFFNPLQFNQQTRFFQISFDHISDWQLINLDFQHFFPLAMSHANIIIKCRDFSVPAWDAFIKRASKITVVIHPAKLTLIKNVLNPRALWSVIISVPPLFFHTLSDRDVDFINAPREWDSFAQDVSCIIGDDSKEIWAEDESSKPQELGCWK